MNGPFRRKFVDPGERLSSARFDLPEIFRAQAVLLLRHPVAGSTVCVMDEPVEFPINGVLDLHTFKPGDIGELVPDYLAACRERGILRVRIIHGKGIGALRQSVHAILARHPAVVSFALDHPEYGGWGATLVKLKPAETTGP